MGILIYGYITLFWPYFDSKVTNNAKCTAASRYKWWSHCLPFSREGWMASFKATSDFGALIFTFLHSCLLLLYHSVTFETKHGHIRGNIPYIWWSYCMLMSKKRWLLCVKTTGGLGALIFTFYSWDVLFIFCDISFCYFWGKICLYWSKNSMQIGGIIVCLDAL